MHHRAPAGPRKRYLRTRIRNCRPIGVNITPGPLKGTAMSPIDADHFTDMDGNAIEDFAVSAL